MNMVACLLLIVKSNLAHPYQNNDENVDMNSKLNSDSASGECQYINSWLGKDASYDCCNEEEVTCENNHITKL